MAKSFNLGSLIRNVSKIRLPGGTVGKVSHVLIVLIVSVAFLCWLAKNMWITGASIGLLFILCLIILWRLISFANKNPQAALMEGAEFLVHEQIIYGSKAQPQFPALPVEFDVGKPIPQLPESEARRLLEPESPPPENPQPPVEPEGGANNG